MNKKVLIASLLLILIFISLYFIIIYFKTKDLPISNENHNTNQTISIPSTGNDYIIETKSGTKIRVINEYTTEYFTADKNLLIMFGSWCSHCKEEFKEIEQIIDFYKDNDNVNIILIAHEFEDSINNLITLIEEDFNIGNTSIFIDLKRIIRQNLDPEASTVPISYVVNKNGNVLRKRAYGITLDGAKDMLK